jgi:flagellar basal body rod protein FlgC
MLRECVIHVFENKSTQKGFIKMPNVNIDEEVYEEYKLRSEREGRSLKAQVNRDLKEILDKDKKGSE